MNQHLTAIWKRLRLAEQYAIATLLVLLCGMFVIGAWVSEKVQTGVIDNTAINAALFLNSFVAPELQELTGQDKLAPGTIERLDRIYNDTLLKQHVVSFKIWGMDGRVLYSNNSELIGRVFPIEPDKSRAWGGDVIAEISDLQEVEHEWERRLNIPLVEIYSPIRSDVDKRVIAVAEFYDSALNLSRQLTQARIEGWFVVAGTTFVMFALLFGIVIKGSRTITQQQNEAYRRVNQLSGLLSQNRSLRHRERMASHEADELNERYLNRLGSDLHDGPAQILGYGLLRLETLKRSLCDCGKRTEATNASNELSDMHQALREALDEIRALSRGLALPELAHMSLEEVIEYAALVHKRRTNSVVELDILELPDPVSSSIKVCVYRVVQESLNNAFVHGETQVQRINAQSRNDDITIEVVDYGRGIESPDRDKEAKRQGLGMLGMRRRVEGLGGRLQVQSVPGKGTTVVAHVKTRSNEKSHEEDYRTVEWGTQ